MALFGEKYADIVRTITIGEPETFSYELCGGTHVEATGDIGVFLITGEGSAAAGIRRIEAVTGRRAYALVQSRFQTLQQAADLLSAGPEQLVPRLESLVDELNDTRKRLAGLRQAQSLAEFSRLLEAPAQVGPVTLLTARLDEADAEALRQMADRFRQRYPSQGVAVIASVQDGKPSLIAAVTEDLVRRGIQAGELVKFAAGPLGGSGGGRPTLAQAGGKDAARLDEVLTSIAGWLAERLK
jgi:alanyl-tRNA synthetase